MAMPRALAVWVRFWLWRVMACSKRRHSARVAVVGTGMMPGGMMCLIEMV